MFIQILICNNRVSRWFLRYLCGKEHSVLVSNLDILCRSIQILLGTLKYNVSEILSYIHEYLRWVDAVHWVSIMLKYFVTDIRIVLLFFPVFPLGQW